MSFLALVFTIICTKGMNFTSQSIPHDISNAVPQIPCSTFPLMNQTNPSTFQADIQQDTDFVDLAALIIGINLAFGVSLYCLNLLCQGADKPLIDNSFHILVFIIGSSDLLTNILVTYYLLFVEDISIEIACIPAIIIMSQIFIHCLTILFYGFLENGISHLIHIITSDPSTLSSADCRLSNEISLVSGSIESCQVSILFPLPWRISKIYFFIFSSNVCIQ